MSESHDPFCWECGRNTESYEYGPDHWGFVQIICVEEGCGHVKTFYSLKGYPKQ